AGGGRSVGGGAIGVRAAFGLVLMEAWARRAPHTALGVRRAVGASPPPLDVRVALHTEEMLVGRFEDRVELDADGRRGAQQVLDAMLALSSDQSILASATTAPFLERRFDIEPVGTAQESRRVWRVSGLAAAQRHTSPFVSRTRELAVLDDLLQQVEEGRGQAVLVAGDAGIGKTRLLHEFRRRTSGRAAWLQGSAVSFGRSLPLHPLIDLLKGAF